MMRGLMRLPAVRDSRKFARNLAADSVASDDSDCGRRGINRKLQSTAPEAASRQR
jgi:hypothetical protein